MSEKTAIHLWSKCTNKTPALIISSICFEEPMIHRVGSNKDVEELPRLFEFLGFCKSKLNPKFNQPKDYSNGFQVSKK